MLEVETFSTVKNGFANFDSRFVNYVGNKIKRDMSEHLFVLNKSPGQ